MLSMASLNFSNSFGIYITNNTYVYNNEDDLQKKANNNIYIIEKNQIFEIINRSDSNPDIFFIKFETLNKTINGWIYNPELIIHEDYMDIAFIQLRNSTVLDNDNFWNTLGNGKRWKEESTDTKETIEFNRDDIQVYFHEEYDTSYYITEFTEINKNEYNIKINLLYEYSGASISNINIIDEHKIIIIWGNKGSTVYVTEDM